MKYLPNWLVIASRLRRLAETLAPQLLVRRREALARTMILDFDLVFLREATTLVDGRLEQLEREASPDPDEYGVYDQAEYITGFGFVACQTYATGVVSSSKVTKPDALALGPKHRTGRTIIELIDAAANHWKHSPEWSLNTPPKAQKTLEVIASLGVNTHGSYPVANMLHHILTPHPARFANLIPFLTQWRDALPR